METKSLNIDLDFEKAWDDALKSRGIVNILIAGKTGVGKSTLINSLFQGDFADTGQGKPVTTETRKYSKKGIPLSIYDTKGLELKDYDQILKTLKDFIEKQNYSSEPNDHIHLAYLCISEESRRFEKAEIELAKLFFELKIPFIVVITKAYSDQGFKNIIEDSFKEASNWIRVNSVEMTLDGGVKIPSVGLDKLIEATLEIIPDGQKAAFIASQKVSLELKINLAKKYVYGAAAMAAAAGGVPIPFSDAPILVSIQVGMLAKISSIFGLKTEDGILATLIGAVLTGGGASLLGRTIVGNLLKLIPGGGSAVGGAINATTAALITTTFGMTFIEVLKKLYNSNNDLSDVNPQMLKELFLEEYNTSSK